MYTKLFSLAPLSVVSIVAAIGCHRTPAGADSGDAPLFRIGRAVTTVGQIQTQLDQMSWRDRSRYTTRAERERYLDELVGQQVLAAEAERLGYANAPEVLAAARKAMVTKLLKERVGNGPRPGEVSDADVRAYYDAHPSEFGVPEKALVAILYVTNGAKAHAVETEVEQVLSASGSGASVEERFDAFASMVKKYTEEAGARDVAISMGLTGSNFPPEVVSAAAALHQVGGVSPLVETERGYYLLQLKERVAGSVRPFEEVKGHAARAASEQLRDRKVGALVEELKVGAGAEVYADGFKALRFDDGTDLGLSKNTERSRAREALNQEK